MSNVVIVSNRLPVSVKKTEAGIELYPSSGGLATAMSSYANKRNNLWIGWPGIESDDLTEKDKRVITSKLAAYNCQPVFLTKKQQENFYSGYSNSILWPFFHSLEANFDHEERYYKAYREVNEIFADAVMALSSPATTVWVHDYQLLLLPKLLRDARPGSNIGFFLHIPFPPIDEYKKLNHGGSLLRGLLGADLEGFHTKSYAQNFLDACYDMTGAAPIKGGVALKERVVRVADFPIGIDYVKFSEASRQKEVQRELRILQRRYKGKKIILTVDRLDPTKGFLQRLDAYETFLRDTPSIHGKVVMLMLAVPSRGEVAAYKTLKEKVEQKVKQINKTFGNGWKPIVYMYKSVSFEQLNALYQSADVAFVAPIRDGMNLVAKEYVASQNPDKGILILSETAGAAQELRDALLVDPNKPTSLVGALKTALKMPPKELKKRVAKMQDTVSLNTVYDWAGNFMGTLNKPVPLHQTPPLTEQRTRNLLHNVEGATRRLLIFDYDGVLVPFKNNPAEAEPDAAVIRALKHLAERPKTSVAVVSGRSQHDLDEWLGHLPVTLIAEHGAMIRRKGSTWQELENLPSNSWKDIIKPVLQKHAADTPGAFVEEKAHSLVWHYRNASPYYAQKNIAILKLALKPELKQFSLQLFMGNKILEVKRPDITKGRAVKKLLDKPFDFILAIGDDYTDEDMFKALPRRAYSVKVGNGSTHARYRVKNIQAIQKLLKEL